MVIEIGENLSNLLIVITAVVSLGSFFIFTLRYLNATSRKPAAMNEADWDLYGYRTRRPPKKEWKY